MLSGLLVLAALSQEPAAGAAADAGPQANAPPAAGAEQVDGRARVSCTVTAEGRLVDCAVISEEPAGYGFGDAALRTSKLFKMNPIGRDGRPVAGAKVVIPMVFKPPPAASGPEGGAASPR
jgi:TonB family protein